MHHDYWDYYNPDYTWDDDELYDGALEKTKRAFSTAGYDDSEIAALLESGYVVHNGIVIDRHYGGFLGSIDMRTRFSITHFADDLKTARNNVRIHRASSLEDVRKCVKQWGAASSPRLLFRGQTDSYSLGRPRPNPFFDVEGFGEVSLLPSLWRQMLRHKRMGRQYFSTLSPFEWDLVICSTFDVGEIDRRVEVARASGDWVGTYADMEDSNDPVLSAFGKMKLDLHMGMGFNLSAPLDTLLQHYGLLSPVLDLTSDLEVAIYFATHKYRDSAPDQPCGYNYIGTNGRKSVLYVLREDRNEMNVHGRERVMENLHPLRPELQSCVVCRSGPDAMNLAADFLFGIVRLDFDELPQDTYTVSDLFPGPNQDRFLAAVKACLRQPDRVTDFGP